MERYFATQDHSQIWFGFEGKFQAGTLPNPSSLSNPNAAAVFGFAAADTLQVLDVAKQVWLSYNLPQPATAWARYALYFDYLQSSWDLYREGQLVASGLPFADSSMEALTRFHASIEKAAGSRAASYLDAVKVYAGPDFDGDGLDDAWELAAGYNPASGSPSEAQLAAAAVDVDGDGLTASEEYAAGRLVEVADHDIDYYVDASLGDDAQFSGRSAIPFRPSHQDGPKASLSAAIHTAQSADTILISAGAYSESTLSLAGKQLWLRPVGNVSLQASQP